MPGNLTLDELAIKERCDNATPGPWRTDEYDGWQRVYADMPTRQPHPDGVIHVAQCSPAALPSGDADFIAHARQDVPALLSALEAARGEAAKYKAALTDYINEIGIGSTALPEIDPPEVGTLIAEIESLRTKVAKLREAWNLEGVGELPQKTFARIAEIIKETE